MDAKKTDRGFGLNAKALAGTISAAEREELDTIKAQAKAEWPEAVKHEEERMAAERAAMAAAAAEAFWRRLGDRLLEGLKAAALGAAESAAQLAVTAALAELRKELR